MDWDIQRLAALLAVVEFVFRGLKCAWRIIRKPVKKAVSRLISGVINFLERIKHLLESDEEDSAASNIHGVFGRCVA